MIRFLSSSVLPFRTGPLDSTRICRPTKSVLPRLSTTRPSASCQGTCGANLWRCDHGFLPGASFNDDRSTAAWIGGLGTERRSLHLIPRDGAFTWADERVYPGTEPRLRDTFEKFDTFKDVHTNYLASFLLGYTSEHVVNPYLRCRYQTNSSLPHGWQCSTLSTPFYRSGLPHHDTLGSTNVREKLYYA